MNHDVLAQNIIKKAEKLGIMLGSAESCTGGMIAAALTDIAGSSVAVDRGFVTYSNAAKTESLDVPESVITTHGAVSSPVVIAMAEGAASKISGPQSLAVSVSGVAGPGGGSKEKPVGLVWFGLCYRDGTKLESHSFKHLFDGNRSEVRAKATQTALKALDQKLDDLLNTVI